MRTRGAVLRAVPGSFEVADLELDDPREGEIQVELVAAGLCRSDDHVATGDLAAGVYPLAGGHEGAGIVTGVGPGTPGFDEGDHVVLAVPGCGHCRWCATGRQNLCELGTMTLSGARFDDPGSYRLRLDGVPVGQMCGVSAFCETTTVSAHSAVRVPPDVPLDLAALVGCGVASGWGAATVSAELGAGDTVLVVGVGGVGASALQGARYCGAVHVVAVDPIALKREAALGFGATEAVATIEEGVDRIQELTDGRGADAAIVCVGVTTGEHVAGAFTAVRRGGTVVVAGLGPREGKGIPISATDLTLGQKRLQGSLFGASSPDFTVPRLLELWRAGALELDDLVTARYALEDVARGYEDLHAGRNVRGLLVFDGS